MRSYDDSCGIARALDTVGDRWTLLIVRELLLGPKRYTDLQHALRRVAPDMLSQRLRDLEATGLAERAQLTGPGRPRVYRLTEHGRELQPVLVALGRFGSRLPLPEHPPALSPDATAVALLTVFRPERAPGVDLRVVLELSGEEFAVVITDERLDVSRDPGPASSERTPTARIVTTPAVLTRVLWHGLDPADAERSGLLEVHGDADAVADFLAVFRSPLGPVPAARG